MLVVETFLIISNRALDPIKQSLNAFPLDRLKGELNLLFAFFIKQSQMDISQYFQRRTFL